MSEYIKLEVWVPSYMVLGKDEDDQYRNAIEEVQEALRNVPMLNSAIVSER